MRLATNQQTSNKIITSGAPTVLSTGGNPRDKFILVNATGTLYVKLGFGASTSDYTYRLNTNAVMEIEGTWQGPITAIRDTGTAVIKVTEIW